MPVPDEFMSAGSRDARDVERHCGVLEHREVSDVDDVLDVAGVGRGPGIGLGPALIAGSAGELDQRGATVGVAGPGHVEGRQELGLGDQLHAQRRDLGHGAHLRRCVWLTAASGRDQRPLAKAVVRGKPAPGRYWTQALQRIPNLRSERRLGQRSPAVLRRRGSRRARDAHRSCVKAATPHHV